MKTLVTYYSLTGTTKKLAGRMADMLKCDAELIPLFGATKLAVDKYDLVIVGAPIWLYAPAFPVSRFLKKNKDKLPKVAFFCTYQTTIGKSFEKMGRACGKSPGGVLQMMGPEIGTEAGDHKLKEYLEKVIAQKSE
jgi:menaquinone-dependent protoporphyrinogen IX oxidase